MSRILSTGGGFMYDSDGNRVNIADLTRQIAQAQTEPQATADAGAMFIAGGRESSIAVEVSRSNSFLFSGPPSLVIDPGDRLAMTITAPGGLTGSGRAAGNVAWVIEPLA